PTYLSQSWYLNSQTSEENCLRIRRMEGADAYAPALRAPPRGQWTENSIEKGNAQHTPPENRDWRRDPTDERRTGKRHAHSHDRCPTIRRAGYGFRRMRSTSSRTIPKHFRPCPQGRSPLVGTSGKFQLDWSYPISLR